MRNILTAALIPFSILTASAQTVAPAAPGQAVAAVPAEAVLIKGDGSYMDIWIIAATQDKIRYLESKVDTDASDMLISAAASIFLKEPIDFTKAVDLFKARKYSEAQPMFAKIKAQYKTTEKMPGNFSTRAGFYEMECMRKAGDLEGLSAATERFIADPLQRDYDKQQVEVYALWDAVRTRSWERVDNMAQKVATKEYPGNIRAQIGFCHGLALEALKKTAPALNAYNTAIIADTGASEEVAKPAATNIMRMLMADESVQTAMTRWGAEDEVKHASGRGLLLEASAMAHFYRKYINQDLPVQYQPLLRYKEEEDKGSPTAPSKSDDKDSEKDAKKDTKEEPKKEPKNKSK